MRPAVAIEGFAERIAEAEGATMQAGARRGVVVVIVVVLIVMPVPMARSVPVAVTLIVGHLVNGQVF